MWKMLENYSFMRENLMSVEIEHVRVSLLKHKLPWCGWSEKNSFSSCRCPKFHSEQSAHDQRLLSDEWKWRMSRDFAHE